MLVALLGVGLATMLAVRTDTVAAGADRFQQVARYAAESGVVAGFELVRARCDGAAELSALVEPSNEAPQQPEEIFGNNVRPGEPGAPFSAELRAWYEVTLLNNSEDPGFAAGDDRDAIVVLRSTGHGPGDVRVTIEVQVQARTCGGGATAAVACGSFEYAQAWGNAANDTVDKSCGAPSIDLAGGLRTTTLN